MGVEVTLGLFNCFGCGIKGNTYKYLTEWKGMGHADAKQMMIDNNVWTGNDDKDFGPSKRRNERSLARMVDEVIPEMNGRRKIDEHDYLDADGRMRLKVVRYAGLVNGKVKKSFTQYTPAKGGGFYLCNPTNQDRLPEGDAIDKIPIYRLAELKREGDVTFVEGEKCADAINDTPTEGGYPQPIAVAVAGGSKTIPQEA